MTRNVMFVPKLDEPDLRQFLPPKDVRGVEVHVGDAVVWNRAYGQGLTYGVVTKLHRGGGVSVQPFDVVTDRARRHIPYGYGLSRGRLWNPSVVYKFLIVSGLPARDEQAGEAQR